ncbi:hypothetical protein OU789_07160 [Halocynthiibacter sp. C4]|uniref:hypothetical protein n=1 Tax=Halocynthiibacter sp. C4 TaxID=2992758 RepID=UPI00237B9B8C|nr:hypothetical protein [Halocynthiibacter sp. C4]MDE0589698.1 hypothetical protein [Halocynthiibacter sp. C4]
MHLAMSRIHTKGRRYTVIAAFGAVAFISGCSSPGEESFDRSSEFRDIAAETDLTAPSDISNLQGKATYTGVAVADFGGFSGTADAKLVADFDTQEIEGSLTSWKDLDPINHTLRGQIDLSNGQIADDGSFTSQMAGNIERNAAGSTDTPDLRAFHGSASGQIYDSVNGATASHLNGSFEGVGVNGNFGVDGEFVARQ